MVGALKSNHQLYQQMHVLYVFKAGDRDLLMWLLAVGEGEAAIFAGDKWVWPAAESQALIQALDQAVQQLNVAAP